MNQSLVFLGYIKKMIYCHNLIYLHVAMHLDVLYFEAVRKKHSVYKNVVKNWVASDFAVV